MRQTIRDRNNQALGFIDDLGGGKQRAHDINNRPIGMYEPSTDKTIDRSGRFFSKGNALMALIYNAPR